MLGIFRGTLVPLFAAAQHAHGLPSDAAPELQLTASASDLITAVSYFAIAVSLVVLVYRLREQLPFSGIFMLFGAFIVLCGGTHFVAVIGLSATAPVVATGISALTAVVSLLTALLVPFYIPRVQEFVRAVQAGREADRANARAAAFEESNATLTMQARTLADLNAQLAASLELRLALEAQLRQAQKMEVLGRLAGGVAHDFNNLLSVILGNLEFAREMNSGNTALDEAHMDAVDAAESASALTKRLLQFGRNTVTHSSPISIDAQLRADQRMFRSALPARVQIAYDLASEPAAVQAVATEMQQAVLNLLLNAADAMADGSGTIVVRTQVQDIDVIPPETAPPIASGTYVALTVEDEGTGMSSEVLAHVFEPFYTTKAEGKGTGLGLAMVYDTVERVGGGVSVTSTEGVGTAFTMWLPVVRDAARHSKAVPALM